MMCKVITWCLVVGALSFCLGCGNDNPLGRLAVEGTVTLNGEPLKTGNILFTPYQAGTVGSGAVITEGKFKIAAKKGMMPGEYGVKILDIDPDRTVPPGSLSPEAIAKSGPPKIPPSLIPPEWRDGRTHKVTIKEGERNELKLEIVTK